MAYSRDGSFQLEQNPVRINGPGRKVLTFQKETAIFEFVSDGRINSKGFLAKYNSDVRQEKPGRIIVVLEMRLPWLFHASLSLVMAVPKKVGCILGCGGHIFLWAT